jgi:hypothetical protein
MTMDASCHACTSDREKPLSPILNTWATDQWPEKFLNWGENESASSLPVLLPSSLLLSDSPLSSESEYDLEEDARLELKLQALKRFNQLLVKSREERIAGTSQVPIIIE